MKKTAFIVAYFCLIYSAPCQKPADIVAPPLGGYEYLSCDKEQAEFSIDVHVQRLSSGKERRLQIYFRRVRDSDDWGCLYGFGDSEQVNVSILPSRGGPDGIPLRITFKEGDGLESKETFTVPYHEARQEQGDIAITVRYKKTEQSATAKP